MATQELAVRHDQRITSTSWELTDEQKALLRDAVAKGATDDELKFCFEVARRYRLDPFRRQIYFVKRNDKSSSKGYRFIPMVSIDGLLHVASRDHADYGVNDEPEFGPMLSVKWAFQQKDGRRVTGEISAPEWAKVAVWKKGCERPTVSTVWWSEIYPDVGSSPMVRQMPRLMLGKCALAQAVRRAYPESGGLYVEEEFAGGRKWPEETLEQEAEHNPALAEYQKREAEQLEKLQPAENLEEKLSASVAATAKQPDKVCYQCGEVGHLGQDCKVLGAKKETKKQEGGDLKEEVLQGMIKVNGVVKRETKDKHQFLQVHLLTEGDKEEVLSCFDNPTYPDSSSLFGILELVTWPKVCKGKAVPASFCVVRVGQYTNIRRPIFIANVYFDEQGVPMLDRSQQ